MTSTDQFALTYTGERYHPELLDEIRQEHMHRYLWALGLVGGRDVIDLACGEGFGSAMLAGVARRVIGIDISESAVRHAASRYQAPNLSFQCADAASLPLTDHSVDVVVSFETIEHLANQAGMMAEIRRVLRPDGFLVMSSPNTEIYSQRQGHVNEFHARELTGREFEDVLRQQFPAFRLFGQRLSVASSILSCHDDAGGTASVFRDGQSAERSAREIPDTMYYVAVAAANERHLPNLQASFLVSATYDVYWKIRDETIKIRAGMEQLAEEARLLWPEKDRLAAESTCLRAEKDRLAAEFGALSAEKDRLAAESGQLRAERDGLTAEFGPLSAEKDRLGAESRLLWAEKDRLAAESGLLRAEKDRLAAEFGRLRAEKDRLAAEFELLKAEKDGLAAELGLLSAEKEKLVAENRSQEGLLKLAAEYLRPGWRKKLKPSPFFDSQYYLACNPDVAKSRINPLLHYLRFGRLEGRLPKAPQQGASNSNYIACRSGG
ncbi:methyltransferase domain-containing protein [Bradyrhizobium barranii subsp. apii]|uniref:class I SAM-dependent methyltransferase n=1 Tax=Bradyrhizobium barranii TaxID=2992140 RepID=UPI001AA1B526|nr:class I SAM-dependent methyltransferase [Bradyrhizobium barranii]UPT96065.1 methyltransferase domain-containing protein [Bradyrhizobium barranii subsp. apii]